MTDLKEKIVELHARKDALESSAKAHEVAARSDRAERDELKLQLNELGQAAVTNTALDALQKSQQTLDIVNALVHDRAKEVTSMLDEMRALMRSLQEEFEKVKAEKASE